MSEFRRKATTDRRKGNRRASVVDVPPVVPVPPEPIPVPPVTGSNEPSGMTAMAENDMSTLQPSGWFQSGGSNVAVSSDPTAPRSPNGIVVQTFRPGLPGGSAPGAIGTSNFAPKRTIYASVWFKYSPDYVGHSGGTNKIMFFVLDGRLVAYLAAWGSGSGTLLAGVGLQGLAQAYPNPAGGPASTSVNLTGSRPVIRGQWQRWEALFVANSNGANGTVTLWIDGVQAMKYENIAYVNGSPLWGEVNWSPVYGGTGGSIVAPFSMSCDHMYFSGK